MDRPDAKTVAMIAMSANAFHDDVEQSLAAGMNVHMAKPLDLCQNQSQVIMVLVCTVICH